MNTIVILTTDHGTFNGDHGRMGKLQTHEFDACGHIPFIAAHPDPALGGQRRSQLVQLADLYPTVLAAVGRPLPAFPAGKPVHGVDLLPAIEDPGARTRDYALSGQFGKSVTITDGAWTLHQSPIPGNRPLNWYGHCLAKFLPYDLGPYREGRREVRNCRSWPEDTWLSDRRQDPNERVNLAEQNPERLREMRSALKEALGGLKAPAEQAERLGL